MPQNIDSVRCWLKIIAFLLTERKLDLKDDSKSTAKDDASENEIIIPLKKSGIAHRIGKFEWVRLVNKLNEVVDLMRRSMTHKLGGC